MPPDRHLLLAVKLFPGELHRVAGHAVKAGRLLQSSGRRTGPEGRLDEAEIAANFSLQKRCQG